MTDIDGAICVNLNESIVAGHQKQLEFILCSSSPISDMISQCEELQEVFLRRWPVVKDEPET